MCLCSATGCAFSQPARMKCYPQCECLLRSPSLCNAERPFSLLHCRRCCRVLSWPLVQSRWSDEWERRRGGRGGRGASPDRELLLLLLCVWWCLWLVTMKTDCVCLCVRRESRRGETGPAMQISALLRLNLNHPACWHLEPRLLSLSSTLTHWDASAHGSLMVPYGSWAFGSLWLSEEK